MRILITGGCGFIGTVLTNYLLSKKHKITIIDTQWFGNYIKPKKNLKIIKQDIRNIDKISLKNIDTIIHLANIANDPAVELNPELSWDINVLAGQQLIDKAVRSKVKHFIYASSGSVYGIKKEKKVTEDMTLVPISVYNKTKMIAERIFLSYENKIKVHCIRPATVCGYSPRMRLDISVNLLTYHALSKGLISIFGGKQIRPNINIKDLVRVFEHFLMRRKLPGGCYNAGFENISIADLAKKIISNVKSKSIIKKSNDPRSYRQHSAKLLKTGFKPKYNVLDAIKDIQHQFLEGKIKNDEKSHTVKWMKKLMNKNII